MAAVRKLHRRVKLESTAVQGTGAAAMTVAILAAAKASRS